MRQQQASQGLASAGQTPYLAMHDYLPDAAPNASLLLTVLTLELLLTDLSLAAVADLEAKLPEPSMEGASAGISARGTTEVASHLRVTSQAVNCDMRSGRSSSRSALPSNSSAALHAQDAVEQSPGSVEWMVA